MSTKVFERKCSVCGQDSEFYNEILDEPCEKGDTFQASFNCESCGKNNVFYWHQSHDDHFERDEGSDLNLSIS
jgi:uncharacterized Zn finger protein